MRRTTLFYYLYHSLSVGSGRVRSACQCFGGGTCSDGEGMKATMAVLDEMGMSNASADDCLHIRRICNAISRRAARLVAAGIIDLKT